MIYFLSPTGNNNSPGTITEPWQTLESAVNKLSPGDILYVRGGEYTLGEAVQMRQSGTAAKPIVISAYDNEIPVFDGMGINFHKERDKYQFGVNSGAIFFYLVEHIQFIGIHLKNSTGHGIAVRDSNNIIIDRCHTHNTFACGISIWDTHCTGTICHNNKIIGNTVTKATTWDMLPEGKPRGNEPPHEAISVAGGCYFEVAYNTVYDCDKEGIDVKEVSHHGIVHHNHVYNCDRQGLYADAWFGPLTHVDFCHNNVHDCKGAGIVVAVEEGYFLSDINIYNNNVCDNWGSGILYGTFGHDKARHRINVYNNVVKRNGYGGNPNGEGYFWITGGLCLLSAEMYNCEIYNNIFEDNRAFDIGYSDRFFVCQETAPQFLGEMSDSKRQSRLLQETAPQFLGERDIEAVFKKRRIRVYDNLILTQGRGDVYPIASQYESCELYGYELR